MAKFTSSWKTFRPAGILGLLNPVPKKFVGQQESKDAFCTINFKQDKWEKGFELWYDDPKARLFLLPSATWEQTKGSLSIMDAVTPPAPG